MQPLPRLIVLAEILFNASVMVAAAFGLLFIWHPLESEVVQKVFGSILVLLAASALLLAGYRTVRPPRAGG